VSAIAAAGIAAGCGGSGSSTQSTAPGAEAEAQSAATGDIPDNQTFLTYRDPSAGYSISYPEGWTRSGSGPDVTFSDKDNSIHVQVRSSTQPAAAPTTFTKQGPKDPVTGKRLALTVDRYEYAKNGKVAVLDLATPVGVDNVDAYKMISESFNWL
jgi:hypothetical protein